MEKMRCLAVDDERPALELLEDNIRQVPFLDLVGCCRNAFSVLEIMGVEKIDLIFLDIQMPGLTGMQFVNSLTTAKPMIIFVTAYDHFAIESYNLQAVDYLVKPVAFDRFIQACNRAKELFDIKNKLLQMSTATPQNAQNTEGVQADHFFINHEYSLLKIRFDDILFVSGLKDYVKIHLKNKTVLTAMNLKAMEERLPQKRFIRVHKSYIVSLTHIESIRNGYIIIGKEAIPLSENYKAPFMALIDK